MSRGMKRRPALREEKEKRDWAVVGDGGVEGGEEGGLDEGEEEGGQEARGGEGVEDWEGVD